MAQLIAYGYGWFSLPPAPLNHATINSVKSLDGQHIFCWDGTNCAVFDFASRTWFGPFSCPNMGREVAYGPIMSQLTGNYFQIILTDSENPYTYLFNLEVGYIKNLFSLLGTFYSSDFPGYLGTGNAWPPRVYLANQACFYVAPYYRTIFYVCQWFEGPANQTTVGCDLFTGLPVCQFNDGSIFACQGETFSNGLPGTFAVGSYEATSPYNSSGSFFYAADAGKVLDEHLEQNLLGTITLNGVVYSCPAWGVDFNLIPQWPITGFFGSVADITNNQLGYGGGLSDQFLFLLNQNGEPFTYTPYMLDYDDNFKIGEFGLGITITPPEPIPTSQYLYKNYLTTIESGNVFGYFLADYSLGWYLGIGEANFGFWNVLNYQRIGP